MENARRRAFTFLNVHRLLKLSYCGDGRVYPACLVLVDLGGTEISIPQREPPPPPAGREGSAHVAAIGLHQDTSAACLGFRTRVFCPQLFKRHELVLL